MLVCPAPLTLFSPCWWLFGQLSTLTQQWRLFSVANQCMRRESKKEIERPLRLSLYHPRFHPFNVVSPDSLPHMIRSSYICDLPENDKHCFNITADCMSAVQGHQVSLFEC